VAAQDTAGYVELNLRPLGGHALHLELVCSEKRALNVECSSGYLARPLVDRGCVVVGIERDPAAAEVARTVCEDVLVGDVGTMEIPFKDGSFDVVLCGDLVEHLRGPEAFLVRVRRVLAPGGRVVLSTRTVANLAIRLSRLAGCWQYESRGKLDRTHAHLFMQPQLLAYQFLVAAEPA
jgi:2-polyprenyl-3-methyl-5-hydroxy-6-metoxy-1,4-benzoquinol methylase